MCGFKGGEGRSSGVCGGLKYGLSVFYSILLVVKAIMLLMCSKVRLTTSLFLCLCPPACLTLSFPNDPSFIHFLPSL